MMNKKRNNYLLRLANDALRNSDDMLKNKSEISKSYNGSIAAFGVAIAMSGLLPALAIYFHDSPNTNVRRRVVLDVIARMVGSDQENQEFNQITDSAKLLEKALEYQGNNKSLFDRLRKEIEECSIALKQIVRTYNLV